MTDWDYIDLDGRQQSYSAFDPSPDFDDGPSRWDRLADSISLAYDNYVEDMYERYCDEQERESRVAMDRDYKDCIVYAWIMGYDSHDAGGAMFELGPMEIVSWRWQERFK